MVKRKKEFGGDEVLASAAKIGGQAHGETNEEVNSCPNLPGLEVSVKMNGTESESVSVPETSPAATADSKAKGHAPIPVRPPVNHPFLRSSVKRKKKEPTPPPSPPKPDESEKTEAKPDRKRCWEAWSDGETTLFFEAVNEYGKDFDAIQKYIEQRHKKLGLAAHQVKNKNQVRHLYYRTCHKLFSFINPKPDQEKTVSELFALVNFGELRKKLNLKGGITRRVGQRLNQLVNSGQTVIRVRGMNRRVKTPLCKALRKLKGEENKSDPYKLPAQVLMELQPRNNKAWASVQGMAHNPRVRLVISLKKNLGSIISYLNDKWTPHRSKLLNTLKPTGDKQETLRLRLVLSDGLEVTPHKQVTGRFMHSDSRAVFSLDSESRVTKSVAASKAAKVQRAGMLPSARAPAGASLDCTKDVPGLDKAEKANTDGIPPIGKPVRKYKPRKKAKLSNNDAGDQESQPVPIVVSNHRRKSEDVEPMDLGSGDGVKIPAKQESTDVDKVASEDLVEGNEDEEIQMEELKWNAAPEKEITKDQQLTGVLSADNSKNLTMTDIYLMLNKPTRLKFEYEFVTEDGSPGDDSPTEKPKLLNRLLELASNEFTDIKKPKRSISVGTVTSPPRVSSMMGNSTTPPSKASFISQLSRSPGNGRGPRGTVTNGVVRANTRLAAKPTAPAKDKDSGVFLTPAVPASQPQSSVSAESTTTAAEKLFMAQIESLHKQPFLKPSSRRGRKPLVVQRTLLPRPQSEHKGPTRHMMSMSKTGQFTPVQLGIPDSLNQRPVLRPVPIAPGPSGIILPSCSTPMIQPTSDAVLVSSSADGASSPVVSYALSAVSNSGQPTLGSPLSASSPDLSLAMSTPPTLLPTGTSPMNEIEAASAVAGIDTTLRPSPTDPPHPAPTPPLGVPSAKPAMLNPSPQAGDDTMEIVSVTPCSAFGPSGSGAGLSSVGSVGPTPFDMFPSNLALLDNLLPSSAATGGGDGLMDMPMGSEAFTGFNQQLSPSTSGPSVMLPSMSPLRESGTTTPPLNLTSPSSSPFKLGVDNQWLNGESADISLTSFLAHLESPEKKEKHSNPTTSSSTLTIPQPSLHFESSRDSSISRDVDTQLQYMMNENSVEYVAKFADLTANIITAQQEAQKQATVRH